jgi:hypothetical protein
VIIATDNHLQYIFRRQARENTLIPRLGDAGDGDRRLIITVHNEDASPEEFESSALNVEKVVSAGRQVIVRVGPLTAGRYEFIGDFHRDTAKGALVVAP